MKKDISMAKVVLVILSALSLVAMLGAGSVMAAPEYYSCESSYTFCKYDNLSPDQIIVGCSEGGEWICSPPPNSKCLQLSEEKTITPPYPYDGRGWCNKICGHCVAGWSDKQSNAW